MSQCLSRVLGLLLMAASLSLNSVAVGQENSSLEADVLIEITKSEFAKKDEGNLDYYIARLRIEENLHMTLWKTESGGLKNLEEQLKDLIASRESVVNEKLGGLEIDRKTLQGLVANTHFELQRLEWETNAEAATKPKEGESIDVKILKLQVSNVQTDIKNADQLVEIAQAGADRAAMLAKQGAISSEELVNAKAKLVEQLAEQSKLKNELELLSLKIEAVVSAPAIESAKQVANTLARKKTIEEQLTKYALMRKALLELEAIDQQIHSLQANIRQSQQAVTEHQSKLDRAKVLSYMLESANQKLKQRVKEAEAKNGN